MSVWRNLTRARRSRRWSGAIHDSGKRPDHHELAQQPGVSAISLRTLLAPPPRGGLRRLGQMHARANALQLLHDETPPRRGLEPHLELLALKARQEPAHALAMRRRHARARELARRRVDPLGGDLRSVLIEAHHDCHLSPPPFKTCLASNGSRARTRIASSPTHRIP